MAVWRFRGVTGVLRFYAPRKYPLGYTCWVDFGSKTLVRDIKHRGTVAQNLFNTR